MRRTRISLLLVLGMLAALLPMGAVAPALGASPGDIVVNEIMQNPSAVGDGAGEWFEVYNPGAEPVDIEGWTIKDNDSDSHVIASGGPLVVPAGGYLVLGNNTDSLTNGGVTVAYSYGSDWFLSNSADEVVLLDTALVEIDRVEYDGGPAFPDPNGASMALNDPANDNSVGANWCTASTPFGDGDFGTPGAANDCSAPPVAELVVNEIMQNPSAVGDGAGEWFEVYNPGAEPVDIEGWTIKDNDSDSHVIASGGPLVVPAGGYLVLGNNTDSLTNGGVTVAYSYGSDWFLSNSADEVVLLDTALVEIDRVEYDGGPAFPDPNGASMALNDPANDNSVGANWCTASTPFGDGDFGTPGAANDCSAPPVAELVVNEIMQNPSAVGDGAGEWFEVYNPGAEPVDIEGWTIKDNDSDSHVIASGGPLVVPAGGYLVLGNNTDSLTNGGVTVAYSYGSDWFLSNSADEVVLLDTALVEIDRVEYDGGPAFPDPNGASMALNDPANDNSVGANWCTASTPFGDGDFGTPGAANDCSAPPVAELVVNEIMQNPSAVGDGAGEWFEVYNPGAEPVDIEGWTIKDNDSDSHVIASGGPLVVPAGGYLVLGNNTDSLTNGGVTVAYSYGSDWFLSNSADEVVLLDTALVEIDRVEYDGGPAFPDPNGASMALNDPANDNSVGANWCTASTPFGDGDFGTPGAANDCSAPPVAELVVNEIMQNPSAVGDGAGEWFEVYNPGAEPVDIEGWTIKDNDSDSHVIASGGPLVVPAGGYLVLGNNTDSLTNGGVTVAYSYGSDWFLSNSADEVVLLDTALVEIDRVEYDGGPAFPDPNGASMALNDPANDNSVGANWCTASTPFGDGDFGTPGAANDCSAPPVEACGDPATFVHAVQGPGLVSPIAGQVVTVEAVVVGDFQEGDQLRGFFVQEEDADFDGDVSTSEGVFIDESSYNGPDVNTGDLVRATGTVVENFEHTEIVAGNVLVCDYAAGPYGPVSVTLPEATDGDLEMVEGMYIDLTNTMSVAQNYFVGRYGQLTLSSDLSNRLFQPTNQVLPNTPESAALADENNRHLLFLDDGVDVSSCGDNPVPVPYLGAAPPSVLRGGDHVDGLTGVLDYGKVNSGGPCWVPTSFGRDYRLHPTQAPVFSNENPRTTAPDDVGGSLKLVSFNVLNFFNGDGMGGGFPTSRGADSFNEFVRQRIKIYEAMKAIDGDVVGVMEIENDGFDEYSAIAELVKVMNEGPCWDSPAECEALGGYADSGLGAGTYAYIDAGPGVIGTDAIAVGFIYKPASVTPVGAPLIVDEAAFVDPRNTGSDRNRPAIAQTFRANSDGALFTPIVNHLKSKGSPCGPGDDDPEQASCNVTRTLAAEYLVDTVVPAVQAASGDPDVAIIGDLNAYAMEDPVQALVFGGFTDLVKAFAGVYAYSYTFDGLVGYLDHSLANNNLLEQVTGVTAWHINTDEPAVIDYDEDFNPPDYYSPDPYRASDHDPIVVGLELNGPPVCTAAVASPTRLWPANHKFVPVSVLGVTDPEGDPVTITIDEIWQDELVNGENDGNTSPDGAGVGTSTAYLRAERDGLANGRAYHVYFTADDGQNNSCSGEVIAYVPVSRGKFGQAIDDGPLYDSTLP